MGTNLESKASSLKIAAVACLGVALLLRLISFFSTIRYTNFLSAIISLAFMASLVLWAIGLWQSNEKLFKIGGFCFAGAAGLNLIVSLIRWFRFNTLVMNAALLAFGVLLALMVMKRDQANYMVFGWCAAGCRLLASIVSSLYWRSILICLCEIGFAVVCTLILQYLFTDGYTGAKTAETAGAGAGAAARPAHAAKVDFNSGVETLKKLKELLDAGYLTQEEYDAKRADILARM